MPDQITITIDGVAVKTKPGKMVLEAAMETRIYVPFLCYHPGMKPFGACRMCVVEIEGQRGYLASCTVPVRDGMVIRTTSAGIQQIRKGIIELQLAEHPHGCLTCHRVDLCGPQDICLRHVSVNDRCVTCPKNERCELKDTTRYLEMELETPLPYKYRELPIEVGDPFYDRDYNLCIVCGRCVRACEELRGDNAIAFVERAGKALVGTSRGTSLLESGCEFCGACIDVCPVGALVEKDNKWDKPARVERTVCPHCPVGCQINVEVNRFNKVIRIVPELNAPANRGQACFKGKFGYDFVNSKQRLRTPLIRKNGAFVEATWDEALGYLAQRFSAYRGDAFALLTSPQGMNEDLYVAQKFARVAMGTNNVDVTSNVKPELATALAESLGYAAATNTVWELDRANCILAINTNVTEEHNVVAVPIKRAVKNRIAKLVVIDPREVELTHYATVWLRPRPGTEPVLLGGLLKAIVEGNLVKADWVAQNCQGFDELKRSLTSIDLDKVASTTGVPRQKIEEAARLYAISGQSVIIYALDNIPQEAHHDCVAAIADLALLTGNIGRPSTGIYPLSPGANEQGAYDLGCVPHLLPGYAPAEDARSRKRFEDSWGKSLPSQRGYGLKHVFQGLKSVSVKAIYVVGDSPNFYNHELGDVVQAVEKLELLVVHSLFLTPLAQRAHVVLPLASFAEKDGTYTNLERRVQPLFPVVAPKSLQAKPEWWVLSELARRMGASGFAYETTAQVLDEVSRLVPIYGGITRARLEREAVPVLRPDTSNPLPTQMLYSDKEYRGLQWPCVNAEDRGTLVLYQNGFPTGKAKLLMPSFRTALIPTSSESPLLFVPGRVLLQAQRPMEVVKDKLNAIRRDEWLEINPDDARSLGISNGDMVEVSVDGQRMRAMAQVSPQVHKGVVYSTMLFGQLAVQLEASEDPDAMSKVPGLVISPAKVTKLSSAT